jgi:hypothetical protein
VKGLPSAWEVLQFIQNDRIRKHCHPELCEGLLPAWEILHFVQNDNM